jgi:CheY-like chemotaxis protein
MSTTPKVLVVDDHPLNRTLLVGMLRALKLACDEAADGREAVAKAAATPYDLILMDWQMPEMDGIAAARAIRAAETTHHARIIAVTGAIDPEELAAFSAAGMDGHLAKPFGIPELMATVRRQLAGRG